MVHDAPMSGSPASSVSENPHRLIVGASNVHLHPALTRQFNGGVGNALAILKDYRTELERLVEITTDIAAAYARQTEAPPSPSALSAMAESGSRLDRLAQNLRLAATDLESSGSRFLRAIKLVSRSW